MKDSCLSFALVAVAVTLGGCDPFHPQPSDKVKTENIYCTFGVSRMSDHVVALAGFQEKSAWGPFLKLSATDQIRVNGTTLDYGDLILLKGYSRKLTPADEYVFEFIREGEAVYTSTVTTPPTVTVTAPTADTLHARSKPMDIAWSANGLINSTISLRITGQDIDSSSVVPITLADVGTYSVPARFTQPVEGREFATFPATVELTRRITGRMSPSLKGTIEGTAEATVVISSAP